MLNNNVIANLFQNARLECVTATASNHYPLLLVCVPTITHSKPSRRFKFENAWLLYLILITSSSKNGMVMVLIILLKSWTDALRIFQIGVKKIVIKSVHKSKFVAGNWIKLESRYALQTSIIVEMIRSSLISYLQTIASCFFKATDNEANVMKNILSIYEAVSGQAINFQKSEFYCS
jgi:hypothetical protein